MTEDIKIIKNEILQFLAFSIYLSLMVGLIFIDVVWTSDDVRELSLTEITQELILATIVLLFLYQIEKTPAQQSIRILIAGFFSCMLVRELDFLFDKISHGFWLWIALALAIISATAALRQPRLIISGLAEFMRHPAWPMMSSGMLTVLVFSRLFGMHEVWQALMSDGYNRAVKNMAEEGSELLGYTLCLFASFLYIFRFPPQKNE